MRSKLLDENDGLRTWAVVFDKGDEPKSGLEAFATEHDVAGASLTAIGAFEGATLAYFDRDELAYQDIPIEGQVEVLSFIGDIAHNDGEPELHVHCVVGRPDGSTAGGHLREASVWPTLEVVVTEVPEHLCKTSDPQTGLALIDPSR